MLERWTQNIIREVRQGVKASVISTMIDYFQSLTLTRIKAPGLGCALVISMIRRFVG